MSERPRVVSEALILIEDSDGVHSDALIGIFRENREDRNFYGPGLAGRRAQVLMENELGCMECGSEAHCVVDFDVIGDLMQIPTCLACVPVVKAHVKRELGSRISDNSFGLNGWGRC